MEHLPILLEESVRELEIKKDSFVIDATVDGGGHLRRFLGCLGPGGRILGIDWDKEMILARQAEFKDDQRVQFFCENFRNLEKLARSLPGIDRARPDAIFFDLGLSSLQLQASGRGFSFARPEPLLMTFSDDTRPNLSEFLNATNEEELSEIIWKYGEERKSRLIAKSIIKARNRIQNTKDLADIISKKAGRRGKIHPATKTFQALRIYLNNELENLRYGLNGGFKILAPKGRMAVISFHSLEDRIVKNFFKKLAVEAEARIITKKPIRPTREEIQKNPRSRSAKLRIIEKQ